MTIQVILVPNPGEDNTNSRELLLLKFLPLANHHSHFLAASTLDLKSFSHFRATHFFYSWTVLD